MRRSLDCCVEGDTDGNCKTNQDDVTQGLRMLNLLSITSTTMETVDEAQLCPHLSNNPLCKSVSKCQKDQFDANQDGSFVASDVSLLNLIVNKRQRWLNSIITRADSENNCGVSIEIDLLYLDAETGLMKAAPSDTTGAEVRFITSLNSAMNSYFADGQRLESDGVTFVAKKDDSTPGRFKVKVSPIVDEKSVEILLTVKTSVEGASVGSGTIDPDRTYTYYEVIVDGNTHYTSVEKVDLLAGDSDQVVGTDEGKCTAFIGFNFTVIHNNEIQTSQCTRPPSGSRFDLGTEKVTCFASDINNNADSCEFTITVEDNEPPYFEYCALSWMDESIANSSYVIDNDTNIEHIQVSIIKTQPSSIDSGSFTVVSKDNCGATSNLQVKG
eukprot:UC4_evm1s1296